MKICNEKEQTELQHKKILNLRRKGAPRSEMELNSIHKEINRIKKSLNEGSRDLRVRSHSVKLLT